MYVENKSSNQTEQRRYDGGNHLTKMVRVLAEKYWTRIEIGGIIYLYKYTGK